MYNLITILGPTACGKTAVATQLAARLGNAEIISADSRQVFRGMDIGTGKDLKDFTIHLEEPSARPSSARSDAPHLENGTLDPSRTINIPYHLIDICDAGTKYSVFEFQRDFMVAYNNICSRAMIPIMCGGTGLYIESVLRAYKLVEVPVNAELRERLEGKSLEELTDILASYKRLHNTTDVDTARRAIRAIEIEEFYRKNNIDRDMPASFTGSEGLPIRSLTIGLDIPRELRRQRITERLHRRLAEGMVDEVQGLLDNGVAAETLISYGLEYRYLTLYLTGQLSYDEMVRELEIAIHQFAKRQMTYFRGMERRGVQIQWVDATKPMEEIVNSIFLNFKNG